MSVRENLMELHHSVKMVLVLRNLISKKQKFYYSFDIIAQKLHLFNNLPDLQNLKQLTTTANYHRAQKISYIFPNFPKASIVSS